MWLWRLVGHNHGITKIEWRSEQRVLPWNGGVTREKRKLFKEELRDLYVSSSIFLNEVGRVCGTHDREKKRIQGVGWETWGSNLEELGVDGRMKLRLVLKK